LSAHLYSLSLIVNRWKYFHLRLFFQRFKKFYLQWWYRFVFFFFFKKKLRALDALEKVGPARTDCFTYYWPGKSACSAFFPFLLIFNSISEVWGRLKSVRLG
jgi:hypothetical protein